jgi:hypothetical protein
VGFVVDKVALGQGFLQLLRFPLSISFHQCSILFFTPSYSCSCYQEKRAKPRNLPKRNALSAIKDRKTLSLRLWVYQIKAVKTDRYVTSLHFGGEKLMEINHFEDSGVDGRTILQ